MYILATASWVVVCSVAALPMVFVHHISYTDAFFETMSGITTTCSTILAGLDTSSSGLLIWRSMLHWLGGIGFISMALAILPSFHFCEWAACVCLRLSLQTGQGK